MKKRSKRPAKKHIVKKHLRLIRGAKKEAAPAARQDSLAVPPSVPVEGAGARLVEVAGLAQTVATERRLGRLVSQANRFREVRMDLFIRLIDPVLLVSGGNEVETMVDRALNLSYALAKRVIKAEARTTRASEKRIARIMAKSGYTLHPSGYWYKEPV